MSRKITLYVNKKVVSLDENETALDAAMEMKEKFVGSIVITSPSGGLGLFTERDLTMKVIGERKDPSKLLLKEFVAKEPLAVKPDDKCSQCLELMKENRCRHLLVMDGDKFVGLVSLRDMVQLMMEEKEDLIFQFAW